MYWVFFLKNTKICDYNFKNIIQIYSFIFVSFYWFGTRMIVAVNIIPWLRLDRIVTHFTASQGLTPRFIFLSSTSLLSLSPTWKTQIAKQSSEQSLSFFKKLLETIIFLCLFASSALSFKDWWTELNENGPMRVIWGGFREILLISRESHVLNWFWGLIFTRFRVNFSLLCYARKLLENLALVFKLKRKMMNTL